MRTTNELLQIAAAGTCFRLNAASRSTQDVIRIAAAAANKGARLQIHNVSRLSA